MSNKYYLILRSARANSTTLEGRSASLLITTQNLCGVHLIFSLPGIGHEPPLGFSRCEPNFSNLVIASRTLDILIPTNRREEYRRNRGPSLYPDVLKILPDEPPVGLEPTTFTLQKCCSAVELGWQNFSRTSRTLNILIPTNRRD